jgi:hypothetical protein
MLVLLESTLKYLLKNNLIPLKYLIYDKFEFSKTFQVPTVSKHWFIGMPSAVGTFLSSIGGF